MGVLSTVDCTFFLVQLPKLEHQILLNRKLTELFKDIGATLVCGAGIQSFVVKWLHAALGEMQGEWKMDFL